MPLTLLDIVLLVVMLVSALLAMVRGFMREVLSIASWAAAAILTIYLFPRLKPVALQYVNNDLAASAIVIVGVFLGTLLIVSVITIKISDMILDSRVGALDRTLGFLFGLARGLIIVVVAYMFFDWFVPQRKPDWISNAKSQTVLSSTGNWLRSVLPDIEELYSKYKSRKREEQEPPEPTPGTRSERGGATPPSQTADEQRGYGRADRAGLDQLLQGSTPPRTR
jgi:membrane protein required for colicin V production